MNRQLEHYSFVGRFPQHNCSTLILFRVARLFRDTVSNMAECRETRHSSCRRKGRFNKAHEDVRMPPIAVVTKGRTAKQ